VKSISLWPKSLFFVFLVLIAITAAGCAGGNASTPPNENPPSVTMTVSPANVAPGGTATLTWQSQNADSVTIDNGIGRVALSGQMVVTPSATTTYTATATNRGGSAASSGTVTVGTTISPASIVANADKTTINAGDLVTLTWNSSNADSVSVNPPIEIEGADTFPLSGNATVSPSANTTYTFTATNSLGSVQSAVAITVNQVPPTISLTADNTSILPGGSAMLSWTSTNANTISIDQGIGNVTAPNGSQSVSPAATTTYTASATGNGGTTTSSVTINVSAAGQLGVSLSANPTTVSAGQSATLTWDSQNATSVSISNCGACSGLSGSAQVTPSATTTYTATATDASSNTKTATATVSVVAAGGFKDKVKHIIYYIQENRSFDHYFGRLGDYRSRTHGLPATDIDGQDLNTVLTDVDGANYHPFHLPTVCVDITSPGWNESHFFAHRKSGGPWAMDFWVHQNSDSQARYTNGRDPRYTRSLGYFNEQELPYYYELATQFATSDRYFSSAMAPTVPNRMYLFTGTSFGHIRPDEDLQAQLPNGRWQQLTFFEWMTQHNLKWKYYYQNGSVNLADYDVWTRGTDPNSTDTNAKTTVGRVRNISELYTILADPNADSLLAPVVFIEQDPPDFFNEHPSNTWGIQPGANNTKKILDALMASAAWKSSVFILAYDEAGGFYDHVAPVPVQDPDGIAPIFHDTDLKQGPSPESLPFNFTQSGFRVPFVIVSPWVKKNYVSHTPREHTSILAFIEARYDLPPLPTGRDRFYTADDMLEFFDFNNPSWLTPPVLPDQPWKNQQMVNAGAAPGPADPNAGTCNRNLEVAPKIP
jgi:phospholipase C